MKCSFSWYTNAGPPLMIRHCSQASRSYCTCWMCTCWSFFFFLILRKWRPDLFNILCSEKVWNCVKSLLLQSSFSELSGKHFSKLALSLAQIKLFSIVVINCLLIIFIDQRKVWWWVSTWVIGWGWLMGYADWVVGRGERMRCFWIFTWKLWVERGHRWGLIQNLSPEGMEPGRRSVCQCGGVWHDTAQVLWAERSLYSM